MSRQALSQQQRAFTGHLRDPATQPLPPGVEPRRMRIYQELIYNNVEGFLSTGFPVLRSLFETAGWGEIVRAFLVRHRCRTPLFLEIGEEFLVFLREDEAIQSVLPPFAAELAHYEWVELALDIDTREIQREGIDAHGDLMAGQPILSELVVALVCQYPVHRISPSFRPQQPGESPTCLLVYRDRADRVRFLEVNAVTLRMLELIGQGGLSGAEIADRIAGEMGRQAGAPMREAGLQTLQKLRGLDIVLGICC